MTASLEVHALKFWLLMQNLNNRDLPVVSEYARSIELPTLALATPFPRLAERINREVGTAMEKELNNDH